MAQIQEHALSNQSNRALHQPLSLAEKHAPKSWFISPAPVVRTCAWHRSRFPGSSGARLPWPACKPALWSQSLCWFWLPCGHTTDGIARRSAARNWLPRQTPTPNTCCRIWSCFLLSSFVLCPDRAHFFAMALAWSARLGPRRSAVGTARFFASGSMYQQ
jgi:hypothetical protein